MKKHFSSFCSWLLPRQNLLAFIIVLTISLCYFWPVLFGGKYFLGIDYVLYFHSSKVFFKESLLSGELPLWCPYPAGGVFFAANSGNTCFYPIALLCLPFSPSYAFGLTVFLHMIIFTFWFYRLGRECSLSFCGAMFTAMAAFMCGTMLGLYENIEHGGGMAWYPALLACFLRMLKYTSWQNILWLALAGSMQVLAGSPYPPLYSMVSMLIIGVCHVLINRFPLRVVLQRIGATLLAAVMIFLLCAPQLVPTLGALKGVREFGQESLFPKEFSMRPVDWLTTLVPNVLGHEDNLKSFYFGMLPIMLALAFACWVLLRSFGKEPLASGNQRTELLKNAAVFSIFAFAGLILSCGGYLSIDKFFYKIPLLNRATRWFSLFGCLYVAGIFVLGGVAFDFLTKYITSKRQKRQWCIFPLATLCLGLAVLVFKAHSLNFVEGIRAAYWRYIHSNLFMSDIFNLAQYPASGTVLKFSILLIASSALLILPVFRRFPPWAVLVAMSCCLLADKTLYTKTRSISNPSVTDIYNEMPPIVDLMKTKEASGVLYRVFVPPILGHAGLLAAESPNPDAYRFIRGYLSGSVGIPYHISTNHSLMSFREGGSQYIFMPWFESLSGPRKDEILGLWNVKYVIDCDITATRQLKLGVHENAHFQPRAWLSYSDYPMDSLQDCLALTQNSSFKPRDTVLLVRSGEKNKALRGTPGTDDIGTIKYTNNTVTITANAKRDAHLYISDTYEKGWRAYVDGTETAVYRANMNGRAVVFPQGEHTVVFKYSPRSFWLGLWVGILTWSAVCACILFEWKRPRPVPADRAIIGAGAS